MAKYYVYALRSLADRQFYVGLTRNLPARVQAHNLGRVSSTRARVPFELVYWEGSLNAHDAARLRRYHGAA
jgi:putative endonuclease